MNNGCSGIRRAPNAANAAPTTPVANGRQHKIVAATVPAVVKALRSLHAASDPFLIGRSPFSSSQSPGTSPTLGAAGPDRTSPGSRATPCRTYRAPDGAPPSQTACAPTNLERDGSAFAPRRIDG